MMRVDSIRINVPAKQKEECKEHIDRLQRQVCLFPRFHAKAVGTRVSRSIYNTNFSPLH